MEATRERLKKQMIKLDIEIIFLSNTSNIFYLSDLPIRNNSTNPVLYTLIDFSPITLAITADKETVLFCPSALSQFIEENINDIYPKYYPTNLFIDYWENNKPDIYAENILVCLKRYIKEKGFKGKVGFDSNFYQRFGKRLFSDLDANAFTYVNIDETIQKMRLIKTTEEINRIRIATDAAHSAMNIVQEFMESGQNLNEKKLFIEVRQEILKKNCQWNFTTVASGRYSADIYHEPVDYQIKTTDAVRLDIGAVYKGYCTDVARTYYTSKFPTRLEKLYKVLTDAQNKVIDNIKPGVKANELFNIGQDYVRAHGFPQYNRTMIGHGVGLDTEEIPFISPNNDMALKQGMVLAIELPYYIKGVCGLNIEDIVAVTSNGCEIIKQM